MSDYSWSKDKDRFRQLLEAGTSVILRHAESGSLKQLKAVDGMVNLNQGTRFDRQMISIPDLVEMLPGTFDFMDPHPFHALVDDVGKNPLFEVKVVDKTATPRFDELRQRLCRQHDTLSGLLPGFSRGNNGAQMRNTMGEIADTIKAIGEFEGDLELKAIAPNYTTLDRYIP